EPHEQHRCAEYALEVADDRDGAALAHDYGLAAERGVERALRRGVKRPRELGAPRLAAVDLLHRNGHARGRHPGYVRAHELLDLRRRLIRHEPATHLGH